MFNSKSYENSRPDGIPVLEVAGDPSDKEGPRLFVPLKRTELRGEVDGRAMTSGASLCPRYQPGIQSSLVDIRLRVERTRL